jgi:hypothetical protein
MMVNRTPQLNFKNEGTGTPAHARRAKTFVAPPSLPPHRSPAFQEVVNQFAR